MEAVVPFVIQGIIDITEFKMVLPCFPTVLLYYFCLPLPQPPSSPFLANSSLLSFLFFFYAGGLSIFFMFCLFIFVFYIIIVFYLLLLWRLQIVTMVCPSLIKLVIFTFVYKASILCFYLTLLICCYSHLF